MAQCGLSLADILMAGEWRSIAFARYCLTDRVIINPVGVLGNTLRNEAEEDDGEVPEECTRIPRTPTAIVRITETKTKATMGASLATKGVATFFKLGSLPRSRAFSTPYGAFWRKACSP